jgi:hypothetical protein
MQVFAALVTIAIASAANAASTPFRRDDAPTEPGLLHFRNAECSYADGEEGGFIGFSNLPPCNGNCGPCLGTSYFRSVIAYSPDSNPLPYDVRWLCLAVPYSSRVAQIYVEQDAVGAACGSTNTPTAVKLNVTNTCIKLTNDSDDYAYSLFFKSP